MNRKRNIYKLIILAVIVLLAMAAYMTIGVKFHNERLMRFAFKIRYPKLIAMVITAFTIGGASIVFQSVINNTIVTPCLLGMNSLYTLIHTAVVFFLGSGSMLVINANMSFALDLVIMGFVATFIYSYLFKATNHNVLYVLLIGTVLTSFFSSIQSTLTRIMDPNEYDLSGFCVGVVDRPEMLDPAKVQEGDVLIGLASSGIHSNGYSLVRKVVTDGKTLYELRMPQESLGGQSVLDALLEPTRIYVKPVRSVLRQLPGAVRSLAHITGGGITENLNRALPENMDAELHVGTWSMPPVIPFVCRAAHLDEHEALKTFNMGLGMVLVVDPSKVDQVMDILEAEGETPTVVGRIIPGSGEVAYVDQEKLFADNPSAEE